MDDINECRFLPGELVYIKFGSVITSVIDNVEMWMTENHGPSIVIGTNYRMEEINNEFISCRTLVFITKLGLFFVNDFNIMKHDEYASGTHLLPKYRIR